MKNWGFRRAELANQWPFNGLLHACNLNLGWTDSVGPWTCSMPVAPPAITNSAEVQHVTRCPQAILCCVVLGEWMSLSDGPSKKLLPPLTCRTLRSYQTWKENRICFYCIVMVPFSPCSNTFCRHWLQCSGSLGLVTGVSSSNHDLKALAGLMGKSLCHLGK